jgi:hypothetical protein
LSLLVKFLVSPKLRNVKLALIEESMFK